MRKAICLLSLTLLLGGCAEDLGVNLADPVSSGETASKDKVNIQDKHQQVLIQNETITITYLGVNRNIKNTFGNAHELYFEATNQFSEPLLMRIKELTVNGKVVDPYIQTFSLNLEVGETATNPLLLQEYTGEPFPQLDGDVTITFEVMNQSGTGLHEEYTATIKAK